MNRMYRSGRSAILSAALTGLFSTALCNLVQADDLFVASPTTLILQGSPFSGSFTTIGACGGQARSMALDGADLMIGDPNGHIYRFVAATNQLTYAYDVPNDAAALVVTNGELLSGGSDSTVVRVNVQTGAHIATLTAPVPVTALALNGSTLYVGSSAGVVMFGSAVSGGFQFFGVCGGPISSMAFDTTHLLLGSSIGNVYRLNLASQTIDGFFSVPNDAVSAALHLGDLLVGGSDGTIVRVDRTTGALKATLQTSVPVGALAVNDGVEPGGIYCYGIGCPCGNDDPNAGCANSSGFGGRVVGSGSSSVAADDLRLTTFQLPHNRMGRFYMAPSFVQIPFGDGFLCAGSGGYGIFRFPVMNSGATGSMEIADIVDYANQNFPPTGHIAPGSTWNFQAWYRDPTGPCGGTFNTSNAYSLTFVP